MTSERTLLIIKPDGVRRSLVGLIITRIEQMGLVISNMRMFSMDDVFARTFYAEHNGQDFFPALLSFMTSGPVVALLSAQFVEGRGPSHEGYRAM